jgi:glycosyltransferase involved in cell wall biosynthesis
MRLAMVITSLDVGGGMQKLTLRLATNLQEMGHDVTIFTLAVDRAQCYPELLERVHVEQVHSHATISRLKQGQSTILDAIGHAVMRDFSQMRAYSALGDAIEGVDALIIHDQESLLTAARFHKRYPGTPILWMVNIEVDRRRLRAPVWIYSHYRSGGLRSAFLAPLGAPGAIALARKSRVGLDAVTLLTTYDRSNCEVVEAELGKKARTVFAGADVDIQSRQIQLGRAHNNSKPLHILCIGFMFRFRRYEDVIEATSILRKQHHLDVQCTIVGSSRFADRYREELGVLVESLELERHVTFTGYASEVELHELRHDSAFEAAAAGGPGGITRNIGAADLIIDGRHGWTVPPRDAPSMARALLEIYTDPEEAATRADRALHEVVPLVTWRAFAGRMVDAIEAAQELTTPGPRT